MVPLRASTEDPRAIPLVDQSGLHFRRVARMRARSLTRSSRSSRSACGDRVRAAVRRSCDRSRAGAARFAV